MAINFPSSPSNGDTYTYGGRTWTFTTGKGWSSGTPWGNTFNLVNGFTASVYDAGTQSSGTFTPDPTLRNLQKAVNGGAHTLAPPSTGAGDSLSMILQYTNNGSAGAITTSGFTKVEGSFTTTNGDDFLCFISVVGAFSHLNIVPLQ